MSDPADPDGTIRASNIRAIPDLAIHPDYMGGQAANGAAPDGYTWVDLSDPTYAVPPPPPTIMGLLYAGRRHVISGPPESAKTLVAYILLLEAQRAGQGTCILDFEMGPHAASTLLRELGATNEELQAIHYTEPTEPPPEQTIARIVGLGVGYCLIDAAAGAYDTSGLNDNDRKDAERFAGRWIKPLWQAGVATIVVDHVTKDAKGRGMFTIGSERKTGQADVHLALEAVKTLSRGQDGLVKVTVHKDRPGHLPRPTVCTIQLSSDPTTHHIAWDVQEAEQHDDDNPFLPTHLMGKVSAWLEAHQEDQPHSQTHIRESVTGSPNYIIQAIDALVLHGYATRTPGPRGAKHITHVSTYTEGDEITPPVHPYSPVHDPYKIGEETTRTPVFSPTGGNTGTGRSAPPQPPPVHSVQVDVFDEKVQALLDDDPPIPF